MLWSESFDRASTRERKSTETIRPSKVNELPRSARISTFVAVFRLGENCTRTSIPGANACGETDWPPLATVVTGVMCSEIFCGLMGSRKVSWDLAASYRTTCPFSSTAADPPVRTERASNFPWSMTVSIDTTDPGGMVIKRVSAFWETS